MSPVEKSHGLGSTDEAVKRIVAFVSVCVWGVCSLYGMCYMCGKCHVCCVLLCGVWYMCKVCYI